MSCTGSSKPSEMSQTTVGGSASHRVTPRPAAGTDGFPTGPRRPGLVDVNRGRPSTACLFIASVPAAEVDTRGLISAQDSITGANTKNE